MKNLILLIMLIFIAAGISFAIPFLPSVGGKAGKADREAYKKRAYNYDGKVFHNDPEVNVMEKVEDNDPARMSGNSGGSRQPIEDHTAGFTDYENFNS